MDGPTSRAATKFERENTIKACAIIAVLFGYLIYQGS